MNSIFNVPDSLVKRQFQEECELPPYRTEFMRDRDRILYATAFRRLAGKTQIYTVGTDDHKRNRLTHTLEVAQIARTIARALNLNADLAEAIALAHDFGHTPFGHAGEVILHEIMIPDSNYVKESPYFKTSIEELEKTFQREARDKIDYMNYAYGFKHNLQSVRVAATLEDSYRSNEKNIGLNLTNFTLYGMMNHAEMQYYEKHSFVPNYHNQYNDHIRMNGYDNLSWSFEAHIARISDIVAQWHHDLEDALRENALPLDKICSVIQNALGNSLNNCDKEILEKISSRAGIDRKTAADLSHVVVNTLVNDIQSTSKKNFETLIDELAEKKITSPEEIFLNYDALGLSIEHEKVISFSKNIVDKQFYDVIHASVHHSRNVERMNAKGEYIIRKLFEAYYAHPQQLPDGPILHLIVSINSDKYKNIDDVKKEGVGAARTEFSKIMENPSIYEKSILMRRICDHIASMTDHYAIEEYNNLYG